MAGYSEADVELVRGHCKRSCNVCIGPQSGASGSGSGSGAPADPKSCCQLFVCVSCGAGKYSETTGNDEERDCRECMPGKYSTVRGGDG